LASVNGPSVISRVSPCTRMRLPWLLGHKPPASRRTPAFIISSFSLIVSMMRLSSGYLPASESLVALTKTRNFIVSLPFCSHQEKTEDLLDRHASRKFSPILHPHGITSWRLLLPCELLQEREVELALLAPAPLHRRDLGPELLVEGEGLLVQVAPGKG